MPPRKRITIYEDVYRELEKRYDAALSRGDNLALENADLKREIERLAAIEAAASEYCRAIEEYDSGAVKHDFLFRDLRRALALRKGARVAN